MNNYPYTDELMRWDPIFSQYVLTEAALEGCGVNVRARVSANPSADPQAIIDMITRRVSELIYGYVHSFSMNTVAQDTAIAKIPSLRPVMLKALTQQALYFLEKGDISHSLDERERALSIDLSAKGTLEQMIPELGTSILYAGGR